MDERRKGKVIGANKKDCDDQKFFASKTRVLFYLALSWTGMLSVPCMAIEMPAVEKPIPAEVQALLPSGMNVIFFRTDNARAERSDAVAILEKTNGSAIAHESKGPRPLIFLRKLGGVYREEARNDKIMACSICGEDGDDPFTPNGIELTPNHLTIQQDHGAASSAIYKFARDPKSQQWMIVSAVNIRGEQSLFGGDFKKTSTMLNLPDPPLAANFDPDWEVPQFWSAVVVNDNTHNFSVPGGDPDEESLVNGIADECKTRGVCHVLLKQLNGCVSLIQDKLGKSYAGSSFSFANGKNDAESKALQECAHSGGLQCKVAGITKCGPGYK